jgi:chromosome segregation ATPase
MTIEELETKLAETEQQLTDARDTLESWKQKHEDALGALHEAFDARDEETHNESIVVMECREAVAHFSRRVNKLEGQVEGARHRLNEAKYARQKLELQESQANARAALSAYEDELIETARDLYQRSWDAQDGYNQLVDPFNQLADQVDGRHAIRISRMDGLDLFNYVTGVLRAAVREGRLGS